MIKGYVGKTQSYTPIEYIESSGPQYIDTGYIPKANTKFVLDCYVVSNTARSFEALFGARASRYASGAYVFFSRVSGRNVPGYNRTGSEVTGSNMIYDKRITLTTLGTTATWTDGTDTYSLTVSGTPTDSSYSLRIFDLNNGGSVDGSYSEMKLYSFKAYENDVLVRDFIPVLDQDGVACLYELVEGKFFYDGRAYTFIAGQVTGQTVSLTSVARKLLKGYVGVPASYTPVEYIESFGTQYIDTEFKPNQNTNMQIDFQYLGQNSQVSSATSICIAGARQVVASNKLVFWVEKATNKVALNYGTYDSGFIANTDCSQRTVLKNQGCSLLYNGTTVASSTSSNFASTYNILLFGETSTDGLVDLRGIEMKLYSFKIWDNDALVRDFIPVINQDNVACLYELIEGKFYFNAGGGTFTAGNTTGQSVPAGSFARKIIKGYVGVNGVAKPIYETMTPINYIQANGTQYIETGVNATQNLRSQMKVNMQAITGSVIYGFSTNGDTNDYRLFNYQSKFYLDMPPSSGRINGGTFSSNTDYNIEIGNCYVKDLDTNTNIISTSVRTFNQTTQTMKVFFSGYGSTYSNGKLYYLKIYDGGTLLRDYIPVLDGNGVPCLYDKVSQTFYYNQGTGTFLYG